MELQLPSSITGLECILGGVHSQAEMMPNTSFRNNMGRMTHEILLIPTPSHCLLDLIKWKYNEEMGYNNELEL